MRWEQFNALMAGGAAMPEPGFAWALEYQVARKDASGKKAIEWALDESHTDLRQLSLVFDWCGSAMSESQSERLGARIEASLKTASAAEDIRAHSARVLAVIAIADRYKDHGESILRGEIDNWWRGMIRNVQAGHGIPREQMYWIYELMHAVRDNLNTDLRESANAYFHNVPMDHLASHYPASYHGPENDFHIPIYVRNGEPDLTEAAMSRAAELAMVGFDSDAPESQFLQGWLMQDRFIMRGALGAPYEFLWANPYQPGLSYFQAPLIFHDPVTGHVFARTSWEEDAVWIGYFDGHLQMFSNGQVQTLRAGVSSKPVHVGNVLLLGAENKDSGRFHLDAESVFILNLEPRAEYDVEVDDEELWAGETDPGGTLVLSLAEGTDAAVRIKRRR
jgi:hypothetical protein